jgi:glyoxylase-like metal-dependent hydrolase (beta-lactamase superfamily II)
MRGEDGVNRLTLGDVTIDRIVELEGPGYDASYFFPDSRPEAWSAEMSWLAPHFYDVKAGAYLRSIQCYVVRTPHHTVLVDACVGNDKPRPSTPLWHEMKSDWLDRLARAGVRPEDIDYVMCTHLHADHVGWNTRLSNGHWVPTFPNARYVFHEAEVEHWRTQTYQVGNPGSSDGCYEDSVLPVIAAGRADLVGNDFAFDDALTILPSPGHSPGHYCVDVRAGGRRAVLAGDAVHHPIQVAYPEWNSRFCLDPELARATRTAFVDAHADTDTTILAAHFPTPTAGRIVSNGARCKFVV